MRSEGNRFWNLEYQSGTPCSLYICSLYVLKHNFGFSKSTSKLFLTIIQGDPSGCALGFVDIKTEVGFNYKECILKHNLCFDVNITLGTT